MQRPSAGLFGRLRALGRVVVYQVAIDGCETSLRGRFFHRLVPAGTRHLVAAGGEDSEGKRRDLEVFLPEGLQAVATGEQR